MLRGEPDSSLETISLDSIDLMEGVPLDKRRAVLRCLHARVSRFEAGDSLILCNEEDELPLRYLLEGIVLYERCDLQGNRSLLDTCNAGDLIVGDSSSEQGNTFDSALIDIVAVSDSTTLDFKLSAEVDGCECCIKHVNRIRGNIISALNAANADLMGKLGLLSCRSTREKIIIYLQRCASLQDSLSFDIEWSRQELADYLYVDRSALSRELSKMEREGLITFSRNHFEISPKIMDL